MDVSVETAAQTERRLRAVMRAAALRVLDGSYRFTEFPDGEFRSAARGDALALVRDGDSWSQLVPHAGGEEEAFGVFSVHFPDGADNSGFVGWLASHLKRRFGTGVFVLCGSNRSRGGIFDYWGCPAGIAEAVFGEVRALNGATGHGNREADRR